MLPLQIKLPWLDCLFISLIGRVWEVPRPCCPLKIPGWNWNSNNFPVSGGLYCCISFALACVTFQDIVVCLFHLLVYHRQLGLRLAFNESTGQTGLAWASEYTILHAEIVTVASSGYGQKNKSLGFWFISRLQNRCSDAFIIFFGNLFLFCQQGKYMIHVYTGTKYHYKVWWLREASQIGQTFIPLCEKGVSKTAWQNSNRSGNFGCNWTSFHSNKKRKLKMLMRRRPETGDFFLGGGGLFVLATRSLMPTQSVHYSFYKTECMLFNVNSEPSLPVNVLTEFSGGVIRRLNETKNTRMKMMHTLRYTGMATAQYLVTNEEINNNVEHVHVLIMII